MLQTKENGKKTSTIFGVLVVVFFIINFFVILNVLGGPICILVIIDGVEIVPNYDRIIYNIGFLFILAILYFMQAYSTLKSKMIWKKICSFVLLGILLRITVDLIHIYQIYSIYKGFIFDNFSLNIIETLYMIAIIFLLYFVIDNRKFAFRKKMLPLLIIPAIFALIYIIIFTNFAEELKTQHLTHENQGMRVNLRSAFGEPNVVYSEVFSQYEIILLLIYFFGILLRTILGASIYFILRAFTKKREQSISKQSVLSTSCVCIYFIISIIVSIIIYSGMPLIVDVIEKIFRDKEFMLSGFIYWAVNLLLLSIVFYYNNYRKINWAKILGFLIITLLLRMLIECIMPEVIRPFEYFSVNTDETRVIYIWFAVYITIVIALLYFLIERRKFKITLSPVAIICCAAIVIASIMFWQSIEDVSSLYRWRYVSEEVIEPLIFRNINFYGNLFVFTVGISAYFMFQQWSVPKKIEAPVDVAELTQ